MSSYLTFVLGDSDPEKHTEVDVQQVLYDGKPVNVSFVLVLLGELTGNLMSVPRSSVAWQQMREELRIAESAVHNNAIALYIEELCKPVSEVDNQDDCV